MRQAFNSDQSAWLYYIANKKTSAKTEYSKTIQCPGTQRNDAIFGQIYDVNISNAYNASAANIAANFNPNKRANARIITDGIEVMDGTLQLRQITAKKDQLRNTAE
jgi:hypothetical protein